MEYYKIYTNGQMKLRLIQQHFDKAAFQYLNDNGEVLEYIVGTGCLFNGDKVTWNWGSYNLTEEQAIKEVTDETKTPATDFFETFSEKVKSNYREFMDCYEDCDTYSDGNCIEIAKDMITEMYEMIQQVEKEVARYKANH